jgi:hypothetical protein
MPANLFHDVIQRLQSTYGRPKPPKSDPFELILWENVVYLLSDQRREAAFEALRERVGVTPEAILAAPQTTLLEIAKMGGMRPEVRVERGPSRASPRTTFTAIFAKSLNCR